MKVSSEVIFKYTVRKLSLFRCPSTFRNLLSPPRDELTVSWMKRNGCEEYAIRSAGFTLMVLLYSLMFLFLGCLMVVGISSHVFLSVPACLLPPVLSSLLVNTPKSLALAEEKIISNESANVISYMTMGMHVNPSLETAVTFASSARGVLGDRLKIVSWRVLTRECKDIFSSLFQFTSHLSESNDSLKHAVHLVTSATFERSRTGMERLLEKANEIVLKGVQNRVNQYTSSLSVPVMILFSLGVILPVMLFTLLLMTSITTTMNVELMGAGMFGLKTDLWILALLLLVVFPVLTSIYARSILKKNPISRKVALHLRFRMRTIQFLLLWGMVLALAVLYTGGYGVLLAVVIPPCVFLTVKFRGHHSRWADIEEMRSGLIEGMYQMGNRMLSGAGFESAFKDTARSLGDSHFSEFAGQIIYKAGLGRRRLQDFIKASGDDLRFPLITRSLIAAAECSTKDPSVAGKVAMNLAQNISDLRSGRAKIREELAGIVDMMRSTATFFAPLVLGVTTSLLVVLNEYSIHAASSLDSMVLMVGLYVFELNLIVTYFTVFLTSERGWREVCYQVGTRSPVAVLVLLITLILFSQGFSLLG